MLGQIRKIRGQISTAILLAAVATMFVSCASQQQQVALVKDPDSQKNDSMIPWNKQEKWETSGQLGGITDRR